MIYTDIKTLVYTLTKTNSTSLPNATLVILANSAMERVNSLLLRADSRWQIDDTNQTDLPIAVTTITSGQKDYSLATAHISIDRVEIKDSAGNWTLLSPIDQHDIKNQALSAYLPTSGIPLEYDKLGSSIFLYPTPNYTLASALKIYFTRPPVAFVAGDTTAVPGFNSLFHKLIPLWIAYDYSMANGLKNANQIMVEIVRMENEIEKFYGQRSRDERPGFTVSTNGSTGSTSGRIGGGASDSNR